VLRCLTLANGFAVPKTTAERVAAHRRRIAARLAAAEAEAARLPAVEAEVQRLRAGVAAMRPYAELGRTAHALLAAGGWRAVLLRWLLGVV